MTITRYLNRNPPVKPGILYEDLPVLLSDALKTGGYPSVVPLPCPRNAVTGAGTDSINAYRLELSAITRGYDRALWIASADAAFLSLEPKPQEKPLFTAFRLNDNRMSFQYRYLLDSFTPESLGKLFTFSPPGIPDTPDKKRSPTIRAFRNKMSESMLFFMASHDSGFDTKNIREKRSANFRTHSSPASPAHYVTKGMYRTYISSITAQAKPAFEYFRKYHAQQLTSLPILGNNIDDSTGKSLRHLTRSSADALQTVFFARSFASQLCRDNPIPDLPQEHKPLYPVQDTSFQDAGREPSIDKRMRS